MPPTIDSVFKFFTETPWLMALVAVGIGAFIVYRIVDLIQVAFARQQKRPADLEKLTDQVFTGKRARKVTRSWKILARGTISWSIQLVFVVAIPFVVALIQGWGLSDGWIYAILMVISFLLNLLLTRLFPLWNPTRPTACRAYERERALRPANIAFHAWGVTSWAVPVYFLWDFFEQYGWIGTILFTLVAQVGQLALVIFLTKRAATPYREYDRLSDEFKSNLATYLESQGFKDDEVGVLSSGKMGPNAFATGIFGYRQITLTKELVAGHPDLSNPDFDFKLGEDTIEAVIAHEVGHLRYHHIEKRVLVGWLISAAVTIAVFFLFSGDATQYGFKDGTSTQLVLYFGQSIFNIFLVYLITFTMLWMGRYSETQADTHLLETNGCKNGHDFFHQIRYLAPVPNAPSWHTANATHPPPRAREDRLRKWAEDNC